MKCCYWMDQFAQQIIINPPLNITIIKLSVMELIIHLHDEWHKLLKTKHTKKERIFMLYDLIGSWVSSSRLSSLSSMLFFPFQFFFVWMEGIYGKIKHDYHAKQEHEREWERVNEENPAVEMKHFRWTIKKKLKIWFICASRQWILLTLSLFYCLLIYVEEDERRQTCSTA